MKEHHLSDEDLRLADDIPISTALMDLMFQILICDGPPRIISALSMTNDIQLACEWMCQNPPPAVWRGLRMIPLNSLDKWSLLLAVYRGQGPEM